MKIWILGAKGQLGAALIDCCQMARIPFVSSSRADLDITNLEELKRGAEKVQCTHIMNCAAFTDVDAAEKNDKKAYAVNAQGPENLGILACEFSVQVVHVSTDYVFDGEKNVPYIETDQPNPLGVYGKSKWEGEQRLLDYLPTACIVRSSWIFGHAGKNFISSILSLLQNKVQILAVDDQINRVTFNRDLAQALLDLACHSGIFHFANGEALSRYQIVQDFFEEVQKRGLPIKCEKISPISHQAFPNLSPRPAYSVLSTDKVEEILGRKPRLWKTVLGEYLDHVTPIH